MQILVMGVSGVGKTLIGELLAERIGLPFLDADAFHSVANIAKMARGQPLTGADREPWLRALHAALLGHEPTGAVLACSALRERYRRTLLDGLTEPRIVFLAGDTALISARLQSRQGHFMSPALLASQFETLEPPTGGRVLELDAALRPAEIVEAVVEWLA